MGHTADLASNSNGSPWSFCKADADAVPGVFISAQYTLCCCASHVSTQQLGRRMVRLSGKAELLLKTTPAGTHSQFSEAKPAKPEPSASQADGSEEE